MSSLNYSEFCRLCLVKERVSTPIFEGEGDVRRIFLKIATCLPIKVSREDHLPKSICDDCLYKVENQYQFWNTTANSEKQLHQWLGSSVGDSIDVKNIHGSGMDPMEMKQESMDMDQGSELSKSLSRVEAVLAEEAGRVAAAAHGEDEDEEEEESEEEGSNSEESEDDDNDADEPNKDEDDEDEAYDEELEPTTFVNVSLACDEAGPSGTQQQTSVAPSTSTSAPAASGSSQYNDSGEETETRIYYSILKHFQCTECSESFVTNSQLVNHSVCHVPKSKFICDICGESFGSGWSLYRHKVVHVDGVKKFVCEICDFATTSSNTYRKHKTRCGKSTPKCDYCDQEFVSASDVAIHKLEHGSIEPYLCVVCKKSFSKQQKLQAHKLIHAPNFNPKPILCEVCGDAFANKTELKRHARNHRDSQKTNVCTYCSEIFPNMTKLNQHNCTHSMSLFACGSCCKTFKSANYLVKHKCSPYTPGRLSCDDCGKTFARPLSLKVHRKYHLAEKPFLCNVCNTGFVTKKLLASHSKQCVNVE